MTLASYSSFKLSELWTFNGDENKKKTLKRWSHSHVHMHVICILIYFIKRFPILVFFFIFFNWTIASFLLYSCVMGALTLLEYWFSSVALFGWLIRLRENSFPCPLSMCPFLAWWWYSPATRRTNTYLKKSPYGSFSMLFNPLRINYEKPIHFKHTFSSPVFGFQFLLSSSVHIFCLNPFITFAWPLDQNSL